jgi:hypothetical protein
MNIIFTDHATAAAAAATLSVQFQLKKVEF